MTREPEATIIETISVKLGPNASVGDVMVGIMQALEKIDRGWRITSVKLDVEKPIAPARRLRSPLRGSPHRPQ